MPMRGWRSRRPWRPSARPRPQRHHQRPQHQNHYLHRRHPMPEEPTYREEPMGDRTVYTCLVPDAGREEGICGHKTIDEGFMTQQQQQMHRGVMVKAPAASEESGDAAAHGEEMLSPPADTAPAAPESPPPAPEPAPAEEPA